MQPTPSDVHVNRPLTNISVAFLQDQSEFIADKVFPNIPVSKQSDRYFEFPRDQWFRTEAQVRPLSSESAGSGFDIDNTPNYFANVFALHKDIDDQLRANQDAPLDLDRSSTEYVTRGLALKREKDWAARYFTDSLWTGSSSGGDITPTTLWDVSGSSPISDIRAEMKAMHQKTGYKPNKLVLSEDVWVALQDNADFLNRISIGRDKIVTEDLLAAVLGLNKVPSGEVIIASGIENVAAEGATRDMRYIYGKHAALYYAAPRPSLMAPTAGYTFSWTGYLGASPQGVRMLRFRMQEKRSDRIEGEMAYDQKVVATDLGVFFEDVVS
jgi:hypothetical protein